MTTSQGTPPLKHIKRELEIEGEESTSKKPKIIIIENVEDQCPFCSKKIKNEMILKSHIKVIHEQYHQEYNDMHLNMFGYQLMEAGEKDMAIEVFNLNVKLFPNIPNVYDSLGEAYINTGNKDLAIKNYKKVLELDPGNNHAKQMVEKLSK